MSEREIIKSYWEDSSTVSLIDKNLRILETDFVLGYLGGDDYLADLGCGGGESTVEYAKKVKKCLGLEQSGTLRSKAAELFKKEKVNNITLVEGDVLDLSKYENQFSTVVTQRVVINFLTWEEQKKVLKNIHSSLRAGGRYLCIENTFEGFEEMNAVRREVGLQNVILHDWHNFFLYHDRFLEFIDGLFVLEKVHNFNLYYLLTRVFVNMFAKFEGFGKNANKDDIFVAADSAARELYEKFGDKLEFKLNKGESFGPIQGFVLRKA